MVKTNNSNHGQLQQAFKKNSSRADQAFAHTQIWANLLQSTCQEDGGHEVRVVREAQAIKVLIRSTATKANSKKAALIFGGSCVRR